LLILEAPFRLPPIVWSRWHNTHYHGNILSFLADIFR
jgi:hypothetical protein